MLELQKIFEISRRDHPLLPSLFYHEYTYVSVLIECENGFQAERA